MSRRSVEPDDRSPLDDLAPAGGGAPGFDPAPALGPAAGTGSEADLAASAGAAATTGLVASPAVTPTGSPDGPAGAGAADAPAANAPAGLPSIDELVRRLFEPLSARLKTELRLDRERAGLITDLRR